MKTTNQKNKQQQLVATEHYQHVNPRQYWRGEPHTDNVKLLDGKPSDGDVIFDRVMTVHEYDQSILANCGINHRDFGWDDSDVVRVVVYQQ